LDYLLLHVRSDTFSTNIADVQNLIEETRKLTMNREALNVR
jgi:hypothetical protein